MQISIPHQVCPVVLKIQHLLTKVDRLHIPEPSRRDVESILVRQVSKEIDRALPWQAGHSRRAAIIALMIGRVLSLTTVELHDLKLASLLHDVGLLTLPSSLLANQGTLESDTYAAVQSHPRIGASLLEPFSFLRGASVLIAHHHERWDGTGYPYGLRGPFIPLGARILSIADAFDAIRVPDDLSPKTRLGVALRILRVAAGSQFDPEIVEMTGRIVSESGLSIEAGDKHGSESVESWLSLTE
jgi:HD-GYP domain-containing protein (c-di-GMP phosphodiesterase class II)